MPYAALPSEKAAVVAKINPANNNNNTFVTDYIDMQKFGEAMFILQLGAVDVAINAKLREATDGSGTGVQDITGKAMTALGGSDDNKIVIFNLKSEEVTKTGGYRYAALSVTVGAGTTNILGAIGLGMCPRFGPASDDDLSAVQEIVT